MSWLKKIFVIVLLNVPFFGIAQEEVEQQTPPDGKAREKIEAARIALITERLGLTPEQAEKFWPVYREFSSKQQEIRKELRDARKQLDPNNPNPEKEKQLVNLGLQLKQRELDLEKDYSGRLLHVITAQQMLNLRNAEREFQRLIINQLQQRRLQQQRKETLRDRNQQLRQKRNP